MLACNVLLELPTLRNHRPPGTGSKLDGDVIAAIPRISSPPAPTDSRLADAAMTTDELGGLLEAN